MVTPDPLAVPLRDPAHGVARGLAADEAGAERELEPAVAGQRVELAQSEPERAGDRLTHLLYCAAFSTHADL